MKFERRRDEGFGSNLYIRLGWLSLTFSRFGAHWYFAIQWSKPLK